MPVAVVTGASRGIGKAIALRLANEGCAVACMARTLKEGDVALAGSLESTVNQIVDAGGKAMPVVTDLASADFDAAGVIEQVTNNFGPVDYLVNNAAAAFYNTYIDIAAKRIDISYRVNVRSPWLLAQAVLPGMVERGSGSVLNVSSATSLMPEGPPFSPSPQINGATAYGGSKAWLERATLGAAAELYGSGVSLNTLAPDYSVATEGATALVDLGGHPIEPLETIVEAAWALLTGDPNQVTGQICLLYTSPSPRDATLSRMPSSA